MIPKSMPSMLQRNVQTMVQLNLIGSWSGEAMRFGVKCVVRGRPLRPAPRQAPLPAQ